MLGIGQIRGSKGPKMAQDSTCSRCHAGRRCDGAGHRPARCRAPHLARLGHRHDARRAVHDLAAVRHAPRHGVHLAQHLPRVHARLEPQPPEHNRVDHLALLGGRADHQLLAQLVRQQLVRPVLLDHVLVALERPQDGLGGALERGQEQAVHRLHQVAPARLELLAHHAMEHLERLLRDVGVPAQQRLRAHHVHEGDRHAAHGRVQHARVQLRRGAHRAQVRQPPLQRAVERVVEVEGRQALVHQAVLAHVQHQVPVPQPLQRQLLVGLLAQQHHAAMSCLAHCAREPDGLTAVDGPRLTLGGLDVVGVVDAGVHAHVHAQAAEDEDLGGVRGRRVLPRALARDGEGVRLAGGHVDERGDGGPAAGHAHVPAVHAVDVSHVVGRRGVALLPVAGEARGQRLDARVRGGHVAGGRGARHRGVAHVQDVLQVLGLGGGHALHVGGRALPRLQQLRRPRGVEQHVLRLHGKQQRVLGAVEGQGEGGAAVLHGALVARVPEQQLAHHLAVLAQRGLHHGGRQRPQQRRQVLHAGHQDGRLRAQAGRQHLAKQVLVLAVVAHLVHHGSGDEQQGAHSGQHDGNGQPAGGAAAAVRGRRDARRLRRQRHLDGAQVRVHHLGVLRHDLLRVVQQPRHCLRQAARQQHQVGAAGGVGRRVLKQLAEVFGARDAQVHGCVAAQPGLLQPHRPLQRLQVLRRVVGVVPGRQPALREQVRGPVRLKPEGRVGHIAPRRVGRGQEGEEGGRDVLVLGGRPLVHRADPAALRQEGRDVDAPGRARRLVSDGVAVRACLWRARHQRVRPAVKHLLAAGQHLHAHLAADGGVVQALEHVVAVHERAAALPEQVHHPGGRVALVAHVGGRRRRGERDVQLQRLGEGPAAGEDGRRVARGQGVGVEEHALHGALALHQRRHDGEQVRGLRVAVLAPLQADAVHGLVVHALHVGPGRHVRQLLPRARRLRGVERGQRVAVVEQQVGVEVQRERHHLALVRHVALPHQRQHVGPVQAQQRAVHRGGEVVEASVLAHDAKAGGVHDPAVVAVGQVVLQHELHLGVDLRGWHKRGHHILHLALVLKQVGLCL
mmetsp:Transcript_13732/g.33792  ORF Transcript_13732/g.33792 Transcript_13732/m.33792 type:complete len:1071 (-) Transcript_13732:431-3643(-)